jgi:imidazolonepropionase-like amidohydrolase
MNNHKKAIRAWLSREILGRHFKAAGALFLFIILLTAYPGFAQTTAIRAGNLVDPVKGTITKNQVILVKDGEIVEVGPAVKIPASAEVIDLSKAWVMPGLMDAHTHLTFNMQSHDIGIEAIYLTESTAMRALRGLRNAQDVLRAGFTTIRDVGNDANYAAVDLRDAINKGWFTGPTVLTSGKIITPFGGQSKRIPPEQGRFWLYEYIDADNADEIRRAVRQNIYYGADLIKLVTDNSAFFYSVEEIRAAADEAHAASLPVSVHALGGEAARNVILGGADSIEHGFMLTDELLKLMKDKGTWLVSTDFPEAHIAALDPTGAIFGGPAKDMAAGIIDRLKRAHQIGVKLVFGTDSVANLPGKNRADMMLDYLAVWEEAGIAPAETLRAMTADAAKLLRVEKKRGTIAAGLAADIIATPANPLENIQTLRQVMFVMKNGKVVRYDRSPLFQYFSSISSISGGISGGYFRGRPTLTN